MKSVSEVLLIIIIRDYQHEESHYRKFLRDGHLCTQEQVKVNDHDFRSLADGIAIPHGLFDMKNNIGYITVGTGHDTAEFACDCIRHYWLNHGKFLYPDAPSAVAKIEMPEQGENIRLIVSGMKQAKAAVLCKEIYCARGEDELYIKDHKLYLKPDSTSCHRLGRISSDFSCIRLRMCSCIH